MITNHLLLKLKTRDAETIKKAQDVLMSMKGKIDHLKDISIEVDIGHMICSPDTTCRQLSNLNHWKI